MKERSRPIPRSNLMTPQEHVLLGSTPHPMPTQRDEWFKPHGILSGEQPIKDIAQERKRVGWAERSTMFEMGLQGIGVVPQDKNIGIPFEELDTQGRTVKDPTVLVGIWDPDQHVLRDVQSDITETAKSLAHQSGYNVPWRDQEGKSSESQ